MTILALAEPPAARRVTMENPALPHQIVLFMVSNELAVSCTCLHHPGRKGWTPIETRQVFLAADAIAAWRAWHARKGVTV